MSGLFIGVFTHREIFVRAAISLLNVSTIIPLRTRAQEKRFAWAEIVGRVLLPPRLSDWTRKCNQLYLIGGRVGFYPHPPLFNSRSTLFKINPCHRRKQGQDAHMSKPPAKKLKIILSEENTEFVRRKAREEFTTPPRFINRLISEAREIRPKGQRPKVLETV